MPLLAGDIRWARATNMADVPEGGGPPSAQLLISGRSNDLLPDISEETRTVGRTEIYQFHSVLRNADRSPLLGANFVIGEPPADPNVSITALSLKNPFATRAQIAKRIESGMSPSSEWNGYLLEDHFTGTGVIQLAQRPGSARPANGRTFVLIYQEGLSGERRQRVRIKSVSTETVIRSQILNGALVEFEVQISSCEIFDSLQFDFPGSPPSRLYARETNKSKLRETVYSDSGLFYSATRLAHACVPTDTWLKLQTIFTQIVPNSRTEVAVVDQRPAARTTITLATAPRLVQVGINAHTQRQKIDEANAGRVYIFQLTPPPAPGTLFIDYWVLGTRYIVNDDGTGRLTGQGAGSVDYITGAGALTLPDKVPDIGSAIGYSYGSKLAYTNRSSQGAQVRAPEYPIAIEGDTDNDMAVPGAITISYPSGGTVRTVTDNGAGKWQGDGAGVIDYHTRLGLLRPKYMPDPGAEFLIECQLDALVTEVLSAGTPDAAGYVVFKLAQVPAAGTFSLQWAVSRATSNTSGGHLTTTNATKTTDVTYTTKTVPEYYEPPAVAGAGVSFTNWPRQAN